MHAPVQDETLAQTATCQIARHALSGAAVCISETLTSSYVCEKVVSWQKARLRCWFIITSQRSSESAALLVQAGCLACQKLWVSNLRSMLPFPLQQHEREWMDRQTDRQLVEVMGKAWLDGCVISRCIGLRHDISQHCCRQLTLLLPIL